MDNPFTEACKEYIDRYILGGDEDKIFDKALLEELKMFANRVYMDKEIEEQKYYTPSIEDIRVRYEYEVKMKDGSWNKQIIQRQYDLEYDWESLIFNQNIRVLYLTKEQIESRGWLYKNNSGLAEWERTKPELYSARRIEMWGENIIIDLVYHFGLKVLKLYANGKTKDNERCIFRGNCKDINTFDYIMKLLNIPNGV